MLISGFILGNQTMQETVWQKSTGLFDSKEMVYL